MLPSKDDVQISNKMESSNVSQSTKTDVDKSTEQLAKAEKTIITMADVHTPQSTEQQEKSIESPKDNKSDEKLQSTAGTPKQSETEKKMDEVVPEIKVTRETPEPTADIQEKKDIVGVSKESDETANADTSKDAKAEGEKVLVSGDASTKTDASKEGI